MRTAIPVNLLTGFLGSGKTTLLNRLLRSTAFAGCAVLINEFGDVGVDHHLVDAIGGRGAGGFAGEVVLLASGCICCTIRGDVASTLRELHARRDRGEVPAFDRVVIETTGLADPAPLVATVMHDRVLQHHFRVGNVVTTVDAVNGLHNLAAHAESVKQVALADRLILTQLDLIEPDAREARRAQLMAQLGALNPAAALNDSGEPTETLAALLVADAFDPATKSAEVLRWLQAPRHRHYLATATPRPSEPASAHRDVRAFAVDLADAVDWTAFSVWLSLLLQVHGLRVLRVKGVLQVRGSDTPVVIHGVQQLVHPPSHLAAWPASLPPDQRRSSVVFIVDGLAPQAIRASLTDFLQRHARHTETS
ncbi:MAG: GTP-binding protein [Leptothrix sp. (in: b-proteobacteria)]